MTEFTAPPFIDSDDVRDRSIYPHVVAKTEVGDDGKIFATLSTNNNDTAVQIYAYWYEPEDGGRPALVIEVDEDPPLNDDIQLVVRRNDGLIHDALSSEYFREQDELYRKPEGAGFE